MRSKRFPKLGALLASFLITGAIAAPAGQASHQTIIGLTDEEISKLVFFSPGHPTPTPPRTPEIDTIAYPDGITDTDLIGIDYRPRANLLYGYGSGGTLYVLRPAAVGTTVATPVNPSPGMVALTGTAFGFDFNPKEDAIRLVSDHEENVRISPDNGSIFMPADTALAFPPAGDPNSGTNPAIGAIAYTNSFHGAPSTTLYGIDAEEDVLVRIGGVGGNPSPNTGELTTIGSLGVESSSVAGFDIETSFGTTPAGNFGYAALDTAPGDSGLYSINLETGAATSLGPIAAGGAKIESITLPLTSSVKFSNGAEQVGEGNVFATVTVERHGRIDNTATVDYATNLVAGDTAEAADFTPVNGTLTFPPNVATQSFTVPITNDSLAEGLETFQVELSNASGNLLRSVPNSTAKVLIVDNDGSAPAGNLRPLLSVPDQSFRQALKKVKASFSCNRACAASLTLFAGKKKVSSKSASLGSGGVRNVQFAIDNADRRLFRQRLTARGLKLTIKGVFTIPGGGGVVRRALTFRAHL